MPPPSGLSPPRSSPPPPRQRARRATTNPAMTGKLPALKRTAADGSSADERSIHSSRWLAQKQHGKQQKTTYLNLTVQEIGALFILASSTEARHRCRTKQCPSRLVHAHEFIHHYQQKRLVRHYSAAANSTFRPLGTLPARKQGTSAGSTAVTWNSP